ncbi:Uu.00g116160.m01.CDS01 [Anthostomella pinea]|uniref:Uu.00g116160.m01.CDS01 n=1 Tax=Anthostomella pinea TaxID=933095 RepID=A0AAI8VAS2_9PEZI|nr:Uu.00g116160.m01.CDS01 [Anthostomella pinea]
MATLSRKSNKRCPAATAEESAGRHSLKSKKSIASAECIVWRAWLHITTYAVPSGSSNYGNVAIGMASNVSIHILEEALVPTAAWNRLPVSVDSEFCSGTSRLSRAADGNTMKHKTTMHLSMSWLPANDLLELTK